MIKDKKLHFVIIVVLTILSQTAITANSSSPDVLVKILNLKNIPAPYRFGDTCATSTRDYWNVGGGGEIYYYNSAANKSKVYKLENKSLFISFYGVSCSETGNVTAVGDHGIIFHSPDNGNSWQLQESNLEKSIILNAVTCLEDNCWTVGSDGTLLASDNQGEKWNKIDLKVEETLVDVFFINKQIGWIIGNEGGIWKTTDGGKTWTNQDLMIDDRYAHSLSIKFQDEQKGWISGFDFVARTEDGGKTWQTIELEGEFIGIVTQDGEKVWALQEGDNYCSKDAGKTWRECCINMK